MSPEIRKTKQAGAAFDNAYSARGRDPRPLFYFIPRKRKFEMRAFLAACIAGGILWAVDVQFNDGRYSNVVQRAFKSVLAPRS